MSRPAISAVAFALTAGEPFDARTVVHVDPVPGKGNRRLLASVEPLEPSARGFELAALALATLRDTFHAGAALPPAAALTRAFTAANAALLAENRPAPGCRWERRVYVGATAIAISGRDLTIAQVPATQVLVVQERQLYAFPDLASWGPDYTPPTDQPEPDPLGCREGGRPALYRSRAAAGDLVVLCSSAIARHLARDATSAAAWNAESLLRGDLDGALDELGRVVVAHELDDAHAGGVVIGGRSGIGHGRGSRRHPLGRLGGPWPTVTPRWPAPLMPRARPAAPPLGANGLSIATSGLAYARRATWAGIGVPIDREPIPNPVALNGRPDAGHSPVDRLAFNPNRLRSAHPDGARVQPDPNRFGIGTRIRIGVAALSERLLPRRRSPVFAFADRRRALAAPGAGSVHRYRGRASTPAGWRSNLPRGPEVHMPGRLLTVVLAAFLGFGGSGVALNQHRDRSTRAAAALAAVDDQLGILTRATEAGPPDPVFYRTQAALDDARRAGASGTALDERQRALDVARDRAWNARRLTEIRRLGALPDELAGRPVRLVRSGREVYLVGGGLYQVDAAGRRLVRLLTPGARVDGGIVGDLCDAAADDGGLIATDGTALYARGGAGVWTRRELGLDPKAAATATMPTAAFQGSLYALATAPGQILKFSTGGVAGAPVVWADADAHPELSDARDLAIDGRIHVLLADGKVRSFYRGVPQTTLAPVLSPPLVDPVALYGGTDVNFLYLADAGFEMGQIAGRIVRVDAAGNARQLLPPSPASGNDAAVVTARSLAAALDLVVDEEAGLVYFVTADALWRAVLPSA